MLHFAKTDSVLRLFLKIVDGNLQRDDVGILGDGNIAKVGERIIDGDDVLDAHPYPEVDLQGGFLLAVKVGLLLEIANAGTQCHNLLVSELHAEMRIHAQHIALDQCIAFAIEGTIQPQCERGVETFAQLHIFAGAQHQSRHGEFQPIFGDLIARLVEDINNLVGKLITPRIEGGGPVSKHGASLPAFVVVLQAEVQPEAPRVRKLSDIAVYDFRVGTERQARHFLEIVGVAEQKSIIRCGKIGDPVIVHITLRINQLGGVHDIIDPEADIRECHAGAVVDLVADAGVVVLGHAREILGMHERELVLPVHAAQSGGIPVGSGNIVGDGAHSIRHGQSASPDAQRQELVAVLALGVRPERCRQQHDGYEQVFLHSSAFFLCFTKLL